MRKTVAYVAALAIVLLASPAWSDSPDQPEIVELSEDLQLEPLKPDVWLYRATFEMDIGPVESNGLVLALDKGAWVIDTPWTDALTSLLLDWVESRYGRTHGVVATHFHEDRIGGLAEVHRRAIPSYAHERTRRIAAERDLPLPEITFADSLEIGLGRFELFFPGAGHSPDNIVAWIPEHRLLFGGCLLKATAWKGLGFLGAAVVEEWGPSLEALLARYPSAESVVPGHGPRGDLDVVRHTLQLVHEHLDAQAST